MGGNGKNFQPMGIPTEILWEWDGNGNENSLPTATLENNVNINLCKFKRNYFGVQNTLSSTLCVDSSRLLNIRMFVLIINDFNSLAILLIVIKFQKILQTVPYTLSCNCKHFNN